jgi:hypothetical protein
MLRSVLIVLGLVFLAECSTAVPMGSASRQDRQAILSTVRSGVATVVSAFIPNPPVCPGPVSDSVRQQLLLQIPKRLGAFFTSPQLQKEIDIASNVVTDPKGGSACDYGAGVDWVRLDRVSVAGGSAEASGQLRAWSRIAQWQTSGPKMAEPHNTLDVTFALKRISGNWLISRYDWKFALGSEP